MFGLKSWFGLDALIWKLILSSAEKKTIENLINEVAPTVEDVKAINSIVNKARWIAWIAFFIHVALAIVMCYVFYKFIYGKKKEKWHLFTAISFLFLSLFLPSDDSTIVPHFSEKGGSLTNTTYFPDSRMFAFLTFLLSALVIVLWIWQDYRLKLKENGENDEETEEKKETTKQGKRGFSKWFEFDSEEEESGKLKKGSEKTQSKDQGCPECGAIGWRVLCPKCKNK